MASGKSALSQSRRWLAYVLALGAPGSVGVGLGGLVDGQKLSAAEKKAAKQALREQEMLLKQVRAEEPKSRIAE